jgi:uncharacterized membrane protein
MKATMKLGLVAVLVCAVQVAFPQTGPKKVTAAEAAQRLLAHLPGYFAGLPMKTPLNPSEDAIAMGAATARVYRFSTNDFPGADASAVFDIDGTTAVGYFDYGGPTSSFTAFELIGGVYKMILVPAAAQGSIATGINSSGQIVGLYMDSSSVMHAFYDSAGTIETVDNPNGVASEALDINDSGTIVGGFVDSSGNSHGYVDEGGSFTQIDDPNAPTGGTTAAGINDSDEIVGWWVDSSGKDHGFILSGIGGTFTEVDFPFATSTQLLGVNNEGEVSGYYEDTSNAFHGLIYSDGAYSEVNVVGASGTQLARIKNNGAITGGFFDALGEFHGLQGH